MTRTLSEQIAVREPLDMAGASGNALERVMLRDGSKLIAKRVAPESDWISRATGDDGRILRMWRNGVFERFPPDVEHAVVAVEPAEAGWVVFMRDVSGALVPRDAHLGQDAVRRILSAMAALHFAFWGERFPELCSLEQRYHLLSPRTARREIERGEKVGQTIGDCWELFLELVADDIASAIMHLAEDPTPLAAQLDRCEPTLIHGDLRLNNLGLEDDRVVLVDWGERTGSAPAAVELASFLVFDRGRLDVSLDDVIADFRRIYGERFDDTAMDLALIGALVQLGCNFTLPIVLGGGEEARAAAASDLAWWADRVAGALETWSPV